MSDTIGMNGSVSEQALVEFISQHRLMAARSAALWVNG